MKESTLMLIATLTMLLAYPCQAWVIDRDFNSGTLGASVNNQPDGLNSASDSIYDNTQFIDKQSAKLQIKQGETAFGEWGGIIPFPSALAKGKKVYFEMYIYIPAFFQIKTPGNGRLKFLRFYARRANGNNGGSVDVMLRDDGSSSDFSSIKENQNIWFNYGDSNLIARDTWHRINVEFEVDDVPVASGGRSYMKVWLDDKLITTLDEIQTITQPTDVVHNFLLFTYWNGTSPIDQHLWVDNIKISDVRPAWWNQLEGNGGATAPPNDLNLVLQDNTDPVTVGNNFVYSVITTNNNGSLARDVKLSEPLPDGVTYVSDDSVTAGWGCALDNAILNCNKAVLNANETSILNITVTADTVGELSNTVTVSSAQVDSNTTGNADTETTVVTEAFADNSSGGDTGATVVTEASTDDSSGGSQSLFGLLMLIPLMLRWRLKR